MTETAHPSDACNMVSGSDKQLVHGFHLHDRRSKEDAKHNPRIGHTVAKKPVCNVKANTNEGAFTHPICMQAHNAGHALALNSTYERQLTKCPAKK